MNCDFCQNYFTLMNSHSFIKTILIWHVFSPVLTHNINTYCNLKCEKNLDHFGNIISSEKVDNYNEIVCRRQQENCQPATLCGYSAKYGMTDQDRMKILDAHNKIRDEVASGAAVYQGISKASNINLLNYNLELEFSAQCLANTCNSTFLSGKFCVKTPDFRVVSRNFYQVPIQGGADVLAKAVEYWYSDVNLHIIGNYYIETFGFTNNFVPLLWSSVTKIGCGKTYSRKHAYVVCLYNKMMKNGSRIFSIGPPCHNCESNSQCKTGEYPNLCGTKEAYGTFEEPLPMGSNLEFTKGPGNVNKLSSKKVEGKNISSKNPGKKVVGFNMNATKGGKFEGNVFWTRNGSFIIYLLLIYVY